MRTGTQNAVAIVGMSCRFPEADGLAAFWQLLRNGTNAVTRLPPDRWTASIPEGVAWGAFLSEVDRFDAGFFGVSPREAAVMDPQQRLALELAWEALEDAGVVPGRLGGGRTGVFVGVMRDDYARLAQNLGVDHASQHTFTGLQRSLVADRVAHFLKTRGPSMTVDTGQSSSLVAVHLACRSLLAGESRLALAGGVNLNLVAESAMEAAGFGGLSPDGRCHTFDARANGFVRGEGGGLVVLKPLADALADGDRVYCLIAGGATGNDGGGPGLTVPSRAAQEEVLRLAYEHAGIDPVRTDYVELHGTGTKVGDPVEAAALGAVLGAARPPGRPLLVGSVKTNVGHLEAAAGVCGLIKTALAIRHRTLPPSLNYATPNPDIPMDELRLRVCTELTPWGGPPPVAGVSSFGMGGTNCHLVLTGVPSPPAVPREGEPGRAIACVLSGRTAAALSAQAGRLLAYVEERPGLALQDLAYSLATTRTAFDHRAVLVVPDRDTLLTGLRALAGGGRVPGAVFTGVVAGSGARVGMVFAGEGDLPPGSGVELRRAFPVFGGAFDEALGEVRRHREVGDGPQGRAFALRVALYALMEAFGVRPALLAADEDGEPAAGILSLADAAALVATHDRLPVLASGVSAIDALLGALAEMYVRGVPVNWEATFEGLNAHRMPLPTYAFQRDRHWFDTGGRAPLHPTTEQPTGEGPPTALVREHTAAVLGHDDPADVGLERTFADLGFDSLMGEEFLQRLGDAAGCRLPSTILFDCPTPLAVAHHLRTLLAEAANTPGQDIQGRSTAASQLEKPIAREEEPIAIVGMACAYPGGVATPDDLWRLVASGTDAIGGMPQDRGWDTEALYDPDPGRPGRSCTRHGGFLHDAALFDASFFGISPREALAMDPQQRLLLTTAWEAFENAGIDPASVRGSRTAVFAGVMHHDYAPRVHTVPDGVEGLVVTGNTSAVVSGRLAYVFGLRGPAVTVDTACSSSLVALHLAARSLRDGECSLALAGGVSVMATPEMFVEFSRLRGLAPDGRCKSYAAAADGTSWAEGVGLVVLQRLGDARRAGRRVLAVIRGSAVNQDGASNGLSAPHGPAQEEVIREALRDAGLTPGEVDAVEGHGTGTALGDPIEATALLATYGRERPADRPLLLGSMKSNIGHAQAAAGVGGVIKMVLAMRHGLLPKLLHLDEPTPHVDWTSGHVTPLAENTPWPDTGRPRRAAVSSFGISGTNAHLILEQPPTPPEPSRPEEPQVLPWALSAATENALQHQAARLRDHLRNASTRNPLPDQARDASATSPADVGFTLAGRSGLAHRAVVLGGDLDELLGGLDALASGVTAAGVHLGHARTGGRPVMVFPGQGTQWTGMGVDLMKSVPAFAGRMRECGRALEPFVDWSLDEVLTDGTALERVDVVQPALWAVMVSLAEAWRAYGVEPAAVVGHSQGEIAAATVAGALSLEDGARVVALRAKSLRTLSGQGGMMSLALPRAEAERRIVPWTGRLGVAADNGPASTVVSGEPGALEEFARTLREDGVRVRILPVDYASHSPAVERLREEILEALGPVEPRPGDVPFHSSLTGGRVGGTGLDGAYWYRNLREPVEFLAAIRGLVKGGHRLFVEVGPRPALTVDVQSLLDEEGPGVALGTLRRDDGGIDRFLRSAAEAYVHGVDVRWRAAFPGGRHVDLPTYAFQRERYWMLPTVRDAATAGSLGPAEAAHPMLGAVVAPADDDRLVFTARLSSHTHPWLADHAVKGKVLFPGAGFAELALHAVRHAGGDQLDDLVLETPLPLPEETPVQLQVIAGRPDATGARPLTVYARSSAPEWTRHATATIPSPSTPRVPPPTSDTAWPPPNAEMVPLNDAYTRLAAAGYEYGPHFQGLRNLWRSGEHLYAEVALPPDLHPQATGYGIHPALLDAALHPILATAPTASPIRLPFSWAGVRLHATGATALRVQLTPAGENAVTLTLTDTTGTPVATIKTLTLRPLPEDAPAVHRSLFVQSWNTIPTPTTPAPPHWAVLTLPPEPQPDAKTAARHPRLNTPPDAHTPTRPLRPDAPPKNDKPTQRSGLDALPEGDELVRYLGLGVRSEGDAANRRLDSDVLREDVESVRQLDPDAGVPVHANLDALSAAIRAGAAPVPDLVAVLCPSVGGPPGDDLPGQLSRVTGRLLDLLRHWLADETFAASRLVVLTSGAIATDENEDVPALHEAGLWGLVRTAQSENPDRFLIIDLDSTPIPPGLLTAATATGEPELAIRNAQLLAPHLTTTPAQENRPLATDLAPPPAPPNQDTQLLPPGPATPPAGVARDDQLLPPGLPPAALKRDNRLLPPGVATLPAAHVRDGGPHASSLGTAPAASGGAGPVFGAEGTVMITGGSGALAQVIARHLVRTYGVRHLLLVSRSGQGGHDGGELDAELGSLGARVTHAACDVADRQRLAELLADLSEDRPLAAVVHAAGVLADGTLGSLDQERLDAVLRPKAVGAWNLHLLTRHLDLEAFVLFSSVAGIVGNPGQANYAAANTFLDALAHHRRSRGLAATSLAWGLWELDTGMTRHLDQAHRARLAHRGLTPLPTDTGLALFDAALVLGSPLLIPAGPNLATLRDGWPPGRESRLPGAPLRPLPSAASAAVPSVASAPIPYVRLLDERDESALRELIRDTLAAVLGYSAAHRLDLGRAFRELGVDSLTGLELRNRLSAATGVRLAATAVFDHPTPEALARHLSTRLWGDPAEAAPADQELAAASDSELFAIIDGLLGRPGEG